MVEIWTLLMQKKVTLSEEQEIVEYYLKGNGLKPTYKKFHRDFYTIVRVLKKRGVPLRSSSEQNRVTFSKRLSNSRFFNEVVSEAEAYWLGILYADGNIFSRGNHTYKVSLGLQERDKPHMEKFAQIFMAPLREIRQPPSNTVLVRCEINSATLYDTLRALGFQDAKVHKDITAVFNHIPSKFMHHFIRGIFDGDGSVFIQPRRNKKTVGLVISFTGSKFTLEKVREILCTQLGVKSACLRLKQNKTFEVVWSRVEDVRKIYGWMYQNATIWIERKRYIFEGVVKA